MTPLFEATAGGERAAAPSPNGGQPEPREPNALAAVAGLTRTRPELVVAAAFAGGVAIAILARRLAR